MLKIHSAANNQPNKFKLMNESVPLFEAAQTMFELLSQHPDVYQRLGVLVTPAETDLVEITRGHCHDILSQLIKVYSTKKAQKMTVDIPETWLRTVCSRNVYPDKIRKIERLVTWPCLKPDGSILNPGYDSMTKIYFRSSDDFEPIEIFVDEGEELATAKAAAEEIRDLLIDFPFTDEYGFASALALFLSPVARPAFKGPIPGILVRANTQGSGKTLIFDVINNILTGQSASPTVFPKDDDDFRKRVTTACKSQSPFWLLDNAKTSRIIGGEAIEACMAEYWSDRQMHSHSELVLPINFMLGITSNNGVLSRDMCRRMIPVDLKTPLEDPDSRKDFKHGNEDKLKAYARDRRQHFLRSLLTILVCHKAAGRPAGPETMGTFSAWKNVVADAVWWVTGLDPVAGVRKLKALSEDQAECYGIVWGCKEVPDFIRSSGCSASELFSILKGSNNYDLLRSTLQSQTKDGSLPSPRSIGITLRSYVGRNVEGWQIALAKQDAKRGHRYKVCRVSEEPDDPETTEQVPPPESSKPARSWFDPDGNAF